MIPYHHIELPMRQGVAVAVGRGKVERADYVVVWDGTTGRPGGKLLYGHEGDTREPEPKRPALFVTQMILDVLADGVPRTSSEIAAVLERTASDINGALWSLETRAAVRTEMRLTKSARRLVKVYTVPSR